MAPIYTKECAVNNSFSRSCIRYCDSTLLVDALKPKSRWIFSTSWNCSMLSPLKGKAILRVFYGVKFDWSNNWGVSIEALFLFAVLQKKSDVINIRNRTHRRSSSKTGCQGPPWECCCRDAFTLSWWSLSLQTSEDNHYVRRKCCWPAYVTLRIWKSRVISLEAGASMVPLPSYRPLGVKKA